MNKHLHLYPASSSYCYSFIFTFYLFKTKMRFHHALIRLAWEKWDCIVKCVNQEKRNVLKCRREVARYLKKQKTSCLLLLFCSRFYLSHFQSVVFFCLLFKFFNCSIHVMRKKNKYFPTARFVIGCDAKKNVFPLQFGAEEGNELQLREI